MNKSTSITLSALLNIVRRGGLLSSLDFLPLAAKADY